MIIAAKKYIIELDESEHQRLNTQISKGTASAKSILNARILLKAEHVVERRIVAETRITQPMRPGQLARHDYQYKRNGTANLFMLFAPLEGWRYVEVMQRRSLLIKKVRESGNVDATWHGLNIGPCTAIFETIAQSITIVSTIRQKNGSSLNTAQHVVG